MKKRKEKIEKNGELGVAYVCERLESSNRSNYSCALVKLHVYSPPLA